MNLAKLAQFAEQGWKLSTVGAAAEIRNNLRFPISEEEREKISGTYPYFGPTGVLAHINEYRIEGEHILIGEDGDHFLKFKEKSMTLLVAGQYNVNNHAHVMCGATKCLTKWLHYFFMHTDLTPFLTRQGVGRFKLTKDALAKTPILLPPLSEQRKIAEILTTWDEALTQLDALIEAQERRKKALMQQFLTGKKRLAGFKGKWKKVALGDVAENVADQNKGRMGTASLYGVTKAEGVVPMRDHVKGESFDRCKRVETDWFAYNPMRINIGSIARWQGADAIMVSGDYVVFRCHPERLLPSYLDHLRQSWMWQYFVTRGGNGSVRIRIYFSDLAEFTFPCPPLEEQRQIAAILDTADQQLTLLHAQRKALDLQKRGLMQRLLTGKLRVKI
jgi:type I restriction enzyme, S subunit